MIYYASNVQILASIFLPMMIKMSSFLMISNTDNNFFNENLTFGHDNFELQTVI